MTENKSEILIYVPHAIPAPPTLPGEEASEHSLGSIVSSVQNIVRVRPEDVRDQWNRTLDTVMGLSAAIARRSDEWKIDEIEVGLTLSAKGELLFIAEAGA